ncbi:MAG: hypothetical protein QM689_12960 [Oscillospiraceae bacterium]
MKVASIGDIVELNALLKEKSAVVHLRDACGHQSLWIEGGDASLRDFVTDFFAQKGLELKFADDGINFWVL